jgi:hypothetical protein
MTAIEGEPTAGADETLEPLVGVKSARLVKVDGDVRFAPCFPRTRSQPYDAVAVAVCEAGRLHAAPGENCRCGFHAVRTRRDLWRLEPAREAVLLDVELAGHVVEHEYGVRASDQAVLGIHLPATCTKWRCRRPTAGVAPYHSTAYEAELSACIPLRPVCQRCGKRRLIALAELAAALGVEASVDAEDAPAATEHAEVGAPSTASRLGGALTASLWFYTPQPARASASRAAWVSWIAIAVLTMAVLVVCAAVASH